jgi:hypothetical protein
MLAAVIVFACYFQSSFVSIKGKKARNIKLLSLKVDFKFFVFH